MLSSIAPFLLFTGLAAGAAVERYNSTPTCKYIPGDKGWPSPKLWNRLNSTVGGRLIATHPLAEACHGDTFSSTECEYLKENWLAPDIFTPLPGEILHPWFTNQTCDAFTPRTTPCELGNYASYSIEVTGIDDIVAGLSFAKKNNVRLVIKNSGHDYFGKSTGKGALALWTHNLNKQEVVRYKSKHYTGPALKAQSGVTGAHMAEFAFNNGYRAVVGSCPDVGVVGGFTQGGGISLVSGLYGLGADNVLEWEVVTVDGKHLTATPTHNADLYWALSGGGGGTYAVVVSMTTRLFKDGTTSGAMLEFGIDSLGGVEQYWDAVGIFFDQLRSLIGTNGFNADVIVTNDTLSVFSLLSASHTAAELRNLTEPLVAQVEGVRKYNNNITQQAVNTNTSDAGSYFKLYSTTLEPLIAPNPLTPVLGGRLVSRANMDENPGAVIDAMRVAVDGGNFTLAVSALNLTSPARVVPPVAANSVSESLNDAALSIILVSAWDFGKRPWTDAVALQADLENRIMPVLEAATPGAGAYLNEGNWAQQNWQSEFYGSNYDRLRKIKAAYDPDDLLYCLTCVGSEAWAQDGDARLCRTRS
ncbi:FAD-binding domain-containing protein [Xylaria digitata]|nr:FAD-binding domain-containing protein [Xylaria digitata]